MKHVVYCLSDGRTFPSGSKQQFFSKFLANRVHWNRSYKHTSSDVFGTRNLLPARPLRTPIIAQILHKATPTTRHRIQKEVAHSSSSFLPEKFCPRNCLEHLDPRTRFFSISSPKLRALPSLETQRNPSRRIEICVRFSIPNSIANDEKYILPRFNEQRLITHLFGMEIHKLL